MGLKRRSPWHKVRVDGTHNIADAPPRLVRRINCHHNGDDQTVEVEWQGQVFRLREGESLTPQFKFTLPG